MQLLRAQWAAGKFVCVGLDSDYDKIPRHLVDQVDASEAWSIDDFNINIVRATVDTVCAYKPNAAFYESTRIGLNVLVRIIENIHDQFPAVPVIVDAKRGDIGATNQKYAEAIFDDLGADAITINPYLGEEANKPFLERTGKGIIVLCKTSNKGGGEFQNRPTYLSQDEFCELTDHDPLPHVIEDLWASNKARYVGHGGFLIPLYQLVALRVSRKWNKHGNCALVVGATYPEELKFVRQIVGDDMPILVPGIGKQGGDLNAVLANGLTSRGDGLIINSSSGIIFASKDEDFAEAARRETLKLHEAIDAFRKETRS
ncbi:MAG: orotidine-5'-phosphate decarboxylase [Patescibacteria group bacterium]|jgi:orotidine-5'-phosphate decarboxylase